MNPKVDAFLHKSEKWQKELQKLRLIILDCQLTEEMKWRVPCYTFQNKNIVLIGGFKDYCAISFFKGALLNDVHNLLIQPGNHTQAGRLIRFTNIQEIIELEPVLKTYIKEAIEVEKAGLKVDYTTNTKLLLPLELQQKLEDNPKLKLAFEALTPGRRRAYCLYFSAPKQSKTKTARIEKYIPQILNGKGLNDCTCGLSQRMPSCDGSHKYIQ